MRRSALILAWLALVWERLVPVLWPVLTWLAVFCALSLAGLWERIGDPWRALFALAGLAAVVWKTRRNWAGFQWPQDEDVARRVEDDSGISARPHEALIDAPPTEDPAALHVWTEHRNRMAERLRGAHARRPKAAWARLDRWALRGSLSVLLALSWFYAGPNAPDRLAEAFGLSPIIAGRMDVNVDAWVEPPAYTGRAPVFLGGDTDSIEIAEGSEFVVRVAGSRRPPRLQARAGNNTDRAEPVSIGDAVWEARLSLTTDAHVRLNADGRRQDWSVTALEDTPPRVRILAVPEATSDGELDLQFSVLDDYGAVRYALAMRPEDDAEAAWDEIEITPAGFADLDEDNGVRTLLETAQHPLAGSRVDIQVIAEDAAGQIGRSPELGITLPQRVFLDALARAVAEQRRHVLNTLEEYDALTERAAMNPDEVQPGLAYMYDEPERRIERAPDGLQKVARSLDAISDAPVHFFDDTIVYLGLRESLHRLRRARDQADLEGLDGDLWLIAMRAELGSLADAEAALRAAERALMEALARGADETELAALFDAFQEAMDNYMAALAREAVEAGQTGEGGGEALNQEGLQALLDALREAAELGDTADARQALQALSELLRNMQVQVSPGQGDGESDPISEAIAEALEQLGDVIGDQRELQDQTFGMAQEQQEGGQPQSGSQSGNQSTPQDGSMPDTLAENQSGASRSQQLGEMQSQLADQLRRSMEALPNGEDQSLGGAVDAMEQAAQALLDENAQDALAAQEEALADLRAGAEELARELLERMQDGEGDGGGPDGENGEDDDPLGRPSDGAFADGSGVEVPDEMSRARARDILEELRRRAAEAGRPQEELDYIERLLDRF